jgi:diacylglycerol kinase family enzyme
MGGGDGTIHNLFNLAFDKGYTFGIIPLGTVNALARSLAIPSDPISACRVILRGNVRHVDVCRTAGRLFTCFASVGFDASVAHTINPRAKVLMERIAFGYQGIKRLFYLKEIAPFEVEIPQLGKKLQGYSIIISNIPNYAGFHFFSEKPDDGKMEILLFKRNTIPDYLLSAGKMLVNRNAGLDKDKRLFRATMTELFIRSTHQLFLQLDGEPVSLSPGQEIKFEIMPRASRFLAPGSR